MIVQAVRKDRGSAATGRVTVTRWSRRTVVVLVFGLTMAAGCQSQPGSGLPEPVGQQGRLTEVPGAQPSAALPPNHPPVAPPAGQLEPSGPATNRPLPAGTRNPMEDIMAFKARLEKDPKDLEALVSLANANMMISRFDPAQELYVRALAINPKDLNVRTNLAIAYKYGGKPDQAFAELQKNLAMDPNSDSTLYNLGFLYLHDKQDPTNAVATWKKWLALYPDSPAAADLRTQVAQVEAEMTTGKAGS